MIENSNSSVVIAGNNFNVATFKESWLRENKIIKENEFSDGDIFSPVAVNIKNSKFIFLVVPERIQCVFHGNLKESISLFKRIIGKISDELKHSPVTAVGLNFTYYLRPLNQSFDAFNKRFKDLMFCDDTPLSGFFNSDDAKFGVYMSTNMIDGKLRMKLDVKPVITTEGLELLRLDFNGHGDIDQMKDVSFYLEHWNQVFSFADDVSKKLDDSLCSNI